MPLYREDSFLAVHTGLAHTVLLFGLQESLAPPQYKVPTLVHYNEKTKEYSLHEGEDTRPVRPIVDSRIADVEALKALFKFIIQTLLAQNPVLTLNRIPLVWIVPSHSYSRTAVEKVTQYVFEALELTAFNVLDLLIAAAFGLGVTLAALVVNIGHESSQVAPVIGSASIAYATTRTCGALVLHEDVAKLLAFPEDKVRALLESGIYEVINDHADSFYSMADLAEPRELDDEFDVAKIVAGETTEENNNKLENNHFEYNGERVVVGKERFQGSGRLVEALADAVHRSLEQIPDLEKRQELYDNVIFTGGASNIPGLKQAVVLKIGAKYLCTVAKKDNGVTLAIAAYQQLDEPAEAVEGLGAVQVPALVRLAKLPDYFPEWKRGGWGSVYFLGAEIYMKQIYGANSNHGNDSFLDTDIYEERGPQAIWEVCL